MAASISESYVSRPFTLGKSAARELVYDIIGTEDEAAVKALLVATAPGGYQGLALDSIEAEPLGNGIWKGHARYTRIEDDTEYTFDTTGGTKHITQSLATMARYALPGEDAPDFQGAIGVSEDSVEGCDVPERKFEFTETHYFDDTFVTAGYKKLLYLLTGRFNNADFKGLAAGECMFMGATGSKRGDEKWAITYRFSGAENIVDQSIGQDLPPYGDPYSDPSGDPGLSLIDPYDGGDFNTGVITGINALGWDYVWIRYGDFQDDTAFALVKRPIAVYVERVSRPGDFSLMGIGT